MCLNIIFESLLNKRCMNLKYTCSLFLLGVMMSIQASGQKYYSLEECISLAFKNNISIKQRELTKQSAEADKLQSKLNLLPTLNGSATHNYNVGFAINPATNTATRDATFRNNSFGLNSSMVLFNGFQNVNQIKQQSATTKASEADMEATKNNIALSVSNAYMQVLMNKEIMEARKLQLDGTAEQLLKQEKLYELGGASRVKYLQIKAQYASEESQFITAQTQLDQSYLTLWQLLNMNPDTNNQVVKPDSNSLLNIAAENKSADEIYKTFLDKSPEVQAAKQRSEASRINHNIALGGRSPRLTLSGGLNTFYTTQAQQGVGTPNVTLVPIGTDALGNPSPYFTSIPRYDNFEVVPFNTQIDRNYGKNLGLTLSVPIFNGWQVNTNIQKAKITQVSNDLNQKQAELDLYKNVNQAYLDFKSTQKRYESNLNNYEANKESMLMAEAQFNLGAVSAADFIVTKNQYLQAETTLLQSKYELLFRRKVLDFYLGKPLY